MKSWIWTIFDSRLLLSGGRRLEVFDEDFVLFRLATKNCPRCSDHEWTVELLTPALMPYSHAVCYTTCHLCETWLRSPRTNVNVASPRQIYLCDATGWSQHIHVSFFHKEETWHAFEVAFAQKQLGGSGIMDVPGLLFITRYIN